MLKVICAWCGKHLEGSEDADEVSHGICEVCREGVIAEFHPSDWNQHDGHDFESRRVEK